MSDPRTVRAERVPQDQTELFGMLMNLELFLFLNIYFSAPWAGI